MTIAYPSLAMGAVPGVAITNPVLLSNLSIKFSTEDCTIGVPGKVAPISKANLSLPLPNRYGVEPWHHVHCQSATVRAQITHSDFDCELF